MAPPPPTLLVFFVALFFSYSSCDHVPSQDINLENPFLQLSPSSTKDVSCERVRIMGLSRMQLTSYPNSFIVSVNASDDMPERHQKKVDLCFHRNASVGLCQCDLEAWRNLKMGHWFTVMSPYEDRFIDIKFSNRISGSITVSVKEEIQHWRLFCLGLGFLLLLLAPIISNWVPFYYSSSMALGVLLVILLLLFQGMKLLPTGRKNLLNLTLYGSMLGLGSYLAHYFSMFVNSICVTLGLTEEMHNPVSIFALIFVVLSGAAIGLWIVRKFILSEDGNVDAGVAQFVKWSMRLFAAVLIFQSTCDPIFALTALVVCSLLTYSISRRLTMLKHNPLRENARRTERRTSASHRNAEFLSPRGVTGLRRTAFAGQPRPYSWSESPVKGLVLSRPRKVAASAERDYYSTFHRTGSRRFSKKEWEDFTRESTKEALAQWASTPEVPSWIAENVHRIRLEPKDGSDIYNTESSSDSEEEVVEGSPGLFGWL